MREYIGNTSQLFEVKQYTLSDGKAAGTKAIEIWNGSGLNFTILPDRCLDIANVRYNNNNMSFITPSGIVNPMFFDEHNRNWLRSFGAGFLTTCGLQNIGPADPSDTDLTMHGRIANTPAENVCVDIADDGMSVKITGKIYEAMLFGAKFCLKREYFCKYGDDKIYLTDTVTNNGFERTPVSMLYHFNFGYPLLSELAKIVIPSESIKARDARAEEGIHEWEKVLIPQHNFDEMCYYHKLSENWFGIDNPSISTSVRIKFASNGMLDRLVQWRMFGEGEYVTGLEPASCSIEGRADAVANGSQKYLGPGESFTNSFEILFRSI